MANTVSSPPSIGITYSITDSSSDATLTESTAVTRSIVFSDGTGTGLVNMGMSASGYLPSGGFITKDFKSLTKTIFGSDITLDFTNVKGIVVGATWAGPSGSGIPSGYPVENIPFLSINATGSNGFTDLFNGETGNVYVGHRGSWSYVSFTGIPTSSTQRNINLLDSGSGIAYEMIAVGVTG